MKLAQVKPKVETSTDSKREVIPYKRAKAVAPENGQYHTYKLRMSPLIVNSPTYELVVPFFDNKTSEEWVRFRCGPAAVLKR